MHCQNGGSSCQGIAAIDTLSGQEEMIEIRIDKLSIEELNRYPIRNMVKRKLRQKPDTYFRVVEIEDEYFPYQVLSGESR